MTRPEGIGPIKRALLDLGLFYAAMIWGATFFVVKGVLNSVHPVTLVGYRFLFAAACLFPFVLAKTDRGRLLREGLVLGSLLILLYVAQTAGLQFTSAANSGFITGLFILFVPLFLFFFAGVKPDFSQWVAISLALGGLWLLTGGVHGFNKGDALTLLSALAYAAHLLATDKYVRGDADLVLLAFHQFWFCGMACLALAWAAGFPLGVASVRAVGVIAFLALLPNLSAFFIQMKAQKHTPPIKVSLIFSLEPVFAALFAWTLGGEPFIPSRAAGGALILAGMVVGGLGRLPLLKGRKKEVLPV